MGLSSSCLYQILQGHHTIHYIVEMIHYSIQPCESRSAFGIANLKADLLTLEVSSSMPTILYHMVGMTQLARSTW